jgi:Holliday junction resolvase RusA-like endonuclease
MAELVIFIAGKPIAKGSAKWIKSASTGKSVPAKNAPLEEWKARVSHEGRAAFVAAFGEEAPLWNVALHLEADFVFERPKSHYKGGDRERGILKSNMPAYPTGRPDRGKLLRCVEDALQGIIYCDDALICGGPVNKRYGPVPGAQIWLYRLEKQRD